MARFEEAFATWLGVRHAVAVGSGKVALAAILEACGAKRGQGVVLAAYNVPEVVGVIRGLGLIPRFVDIDPQTFNLDPAAVEAALTPETGFLLATHLYGNPAPLGALKTLARRHGLVLVEDCAQALGARCGRRRVGAQGSPALFSFGPMKALNTLKGGMLTTGDSGVARRARAVVGRNPAAGRVAVLRTLLSCAAIWVATRPWVFSNGVFPAIRALDGLSPAMVDTLVKMRPAAFDHGVLDIDAMMAPMGPAQAGAGLAVLADLERANERRLSNALRLRDRLRHVPGVSLQQPVADAEPLWTNVVVRVADRLALRRRLLARGVDSTAGYLMDCSRLPNSPGQPEYPHSAELERSNLYLPVGPELGSAEMDRIAAAVEESMASGGDKRDTGAP